MSGGMKDPNYNKLLADVLYNAYEAVGLGCKWVAIRVPSNTL